MTVQTIIHCDSRKPRHYTFVHNFAKMLTNFQNSLALEPMITVKKISENQSTFLAKLWTRVLTSWVFSLTLYICLHYQSTTKAGGSQCIGRAMSCICDGVCRMYTYTHIPV